MEWDVYTMNLDENKDKDPNCCSKKIRSSVDKGLFTVIDWSKKLDQE